MVQGTASNAGKSLLVAGLCRIFKEDGYRVAPFKAQNMALNSFITKDGREMGRAQAVQAEAAGIEPDAHMNPILLKPTGDTASQVIVCGEIRGNMSAKEYYRNKKIMVPEIQKAFNKLAGENDIIVIEGAGSPAEINLKENDIVNMFIAKLTKAPVLLTGDIDRGGVFAALVGTMFLFDEDERNLVKGLIINKFRGDLTILKPGLKMLEEKAGKPVIGVVPYLDVDIEDEDSLSNPFENEEGMAPIDIAVIRLPRISNFTDVAVFEAHPAVNLRYVSSSRNFGNPDLIVLPGTENVMDDLLWLRQNGLEARIRKYANHGGAVFGICGGYQILSNHLSDPLHVERGGEMKGIGLLPGRTVFTREKIKSRVTGTFSSPEGIFSGLRNLPLQGYEIHMGSTDRGNTKSLTTIATEDDTLKEDGMNLGNVYGSYVHGIFDGKGIVDVILEALLKEKGLKGRVESIDLAAYKEMQYEKLATGIRKSLDIDKVYEILERGI